MCLPLYLFTVAYEELPATYCAVWRVTRVAWLVSAIEHGFYTGLSEAHKREAAAKA